MPAHILANTKNFPISQAPLEYEALTHLPGLGRGWGRVEHSNRVRTRSFHVVVFVALDEMRPETQTRIVIRVRSDWKFCVRSAAHTLPRSLPQPGKGVKFSDGLYFAERREANAGFACVAKSQQSPSSMTILLLVRTRVPLNAGNFLIFCRPNRGIGTDLQSVEKLGGAFKQV